MSDENLTIDRREIDEVEEQLVQDHQRDGCKCDYSPKKSPCCTTIAVDRYRSLRNDMAELSHNKLDLVMMAQVMADANRNSLHCDRARILHELMAFLTDYARL